MNRNKKIVMLIVLLAVVAFVWTPKGNKPASASADTHDDLMPITTDNDTVVRKMSIRFNEWGRDPFIRLEEDEDEDTQDLSNLTVYSIIFIGEEPEAMIDDKIVHVGDKISGKTVKKIEKDKVILTDGKMDYVLKVK